MTNSGKTYMQIYSKFYRSGYRLTVPSRGAQRRVEALRAIGYTRAQIAQACGLSAGFVTDLSSGIHPTIRKALHDQIDAGYKSLWLKPQFDTFSARRARVYARKAGYAPPMAWDDIDTDESSTIYPRRKK